MLDTFEILTTSGVVLWSKQYAPVSVDIVNSLIRDVFIEERSSTTTTTANSMVDVSASRNAPYKRDKYTVKWTAAKDLGVIFVAVYQSLIQLSWIDKLLDNVKTLFTSLYRDQFKKPNTSVIDCDNFGGYFDRQVQELEGAAGGGGVDEDAKAEILNNVAVAEPRSAQVEPESAPEKENENEFLAPPMPALRKGQKPIDDATSTESTPMNTPGSSRPQTPMSQGKAAGSRRSRKNKKEEKAVPDVRTTTTKKGRRWDDSGALDDGDDQVLDYSSTTGGADANGGGAAGVDSFLAEPVSQDQWSKKTKSGDVVLKDLDEEMSSILSSAAAANGAASTNSGGSKGLVSTGFGAVSNMFKNVVGGKTLSEEDLANPIKMMEDHLINKNVAREAANRVCESVKRDLVGTRTASFQSIDSAIRDSVEKALSKILTPSTPLDLLRSVQSVRGKRPYVISVVGVNGVGKSTTLAKLAFLLLHNDFRVLVAAADTFRSGAVEQLGVHVRNLQSLTSRASADSPMGHIDLFQRGYGRDAASIAREAVQHATSPPSTSPYDVVLIDTAGRRHNDARLMSSLAPFAAAANPDKILMVGEALVGTDSVAQARHFNESFGPGRGLDGFIVSKCDTVGEMVGTLVSLVWSTGVPIVAVGVGQHYGDLRGFNVGWARGMLMGS